MTPKRKKKQKLIPVSHQNEPGNTAENCQVMSPSSRPRQEHPYGAYIETMFL
jgi:hypothetical protein